MKISIKLQIPNYKFPKQKTKITKLTFKDASKYWELGFDIWKLEQSD